MNETIIALATPMGESAFGVVRLSGENTIKFINQTFVYKNRNSNLNDALSLKIPDNMMALGKLIYPDTGEVLDEVIVSLFKAPRSYTGEDVAEISCHGNPLILKEILELFISMGARPANPGEFTERAFLNGKIDLTGAEAVNDLIRAHTRYAKISALNQLEGKFFELIRRIHNRILDLLAQIEVSIDHSDIEEEYFDSEKIREVLLEINKEIEGLLNTAQSGKMTREGLKLVIVGAPNTGKSSLMNYLLKEDRVIVSELPGTTRDTVEDELNIKGIFVRLIDTAGVRPTEDLIEQKGIERTKKAILSADLRIMLFDCSRSVSTEDDILFNSIKDKNNIYILNKTDLNKITSENDLFDNFHIKAIPVSILNGNGIEKVEHAVTDFYFSFGVDPLKDVIVTNLRQENLLSKTRKFLTNAVKAIEDDMSIEFIASDIRKARASIEEITGKTTDEDILDRIFSQFCIGK